MTDSKQEDDGHARPGSSSSMGVPPLRDEPTFQALERPTRIFAAPNPPTTPKKKRVYGDRFIPNREGVDLQASFSLLESPNASPSKPRKKHNAREIDAQRGTSVKRRKVYNSDEEADNIYRALIKNEMFGDELSANTSMLDQPRTPPRSSARASLPPSTPKTPSRNLFTFMSPLQRGSLTPGSRPNSTGSGGSNRSGDLPTRDIYSLSPIRFDSQRLLLSPRREPRAIPKVPYKVLDAPDLKDDFYLNLVDWGAQNILAVGLGSSVYLWNAHNGIVKKLVDLGDQDHVTGIGWIQRGTHLAVGTNKGLVRIWDTESSKAIRTMTGHSQRVGSLAWHEYILTSGSRDRSILHRDVRVPDHYFRKLTSHKQEVCGLRWNSEEGQLASGGNDNKLFVWDRTHDKPLWTFTAHTAAVKAISWSPHHRGILASGGGTADRKIRFWNSMNGQCANEVDTGSQVCNLAWSKNSNELVSTHGYSQNQVAVWKYPSMTQVAALTGHTCRVLYLAMSPDGQTIVTGAGDETLRFWTIFAKSKPTSGGGIFDSMSMIR